MKLSRIEIVNFRGIKSASFQLGDHNVLLGQNNSGKSSVIDAIGLLFGRDRLARSLGDYDFFGGNPQPNDRIIIKGLITGFLNNEPKSNPEWFNDSSGGIPVWYDDDSDQIHHGEKIEGTKLGIEIGFSARFNVDDLGFETIRYFHTSNSDPFEDTSVNLVRNHSHLKELGFYLLPAKRTWDRTMTFNSELFKKVLKFQEAIPGQTVVDLRDSLRNDDNHIEDQEPLKDIIDRLNIELSGFLTQDDSKIKFLPNQGDINGVLDSLTPFIAGQNSTNIPIGKHGSGLISLQTLLLLLEFGRYRNESGKNFFFCAEEPELHLQPGLHRRLVARIRGLGNQTIITTHSPEIATYYKPSEILVLNNKDGALSVSPLLPKSQDIPASNSLMRLYTLYRKEVCEALMNRMVILPEGLTDFRWIKLLISSSITAEGWDAYNSIEDRTKSFGIVPTQSAQVVSTYEKFNDLIEETIPLVDGDAAGKGYVDSLLQLESPPSVILEMGQGMELEDLISWIINPNPERINQLEEILEPFESRTLRDFLHENKTHWAYQDSVAEYILRNDDCVRRARLFVNSIYCISDPNDTYTFLWSLDESRSTANTQVFQFTYPDT